MLPAHWPSHSVSGKLEGVPQEMLNWSSMSGQAKRPEGQTSLVWFNPEIAGFHFSRSHQNKTPPLAPHFNHQKTHGTPSQKTGPLTHPGISAPGGRSCSRAERLPAPLPDPHLSLTFGFLNRARGKGSTQEPKDSQSSMGK